jgi:hypothetical protein
MTKALVKLGIEGIHLDIIKGIYNKTMPNILNGRKTDIISSKSRNEIRVSILPILFQYSTGTPS